MAATAAFNVVDGADDSSSSSSSSRSSGSDTTRATRKRRTVSYKEVSEKEGDGEKSVVVVVVDDAVPASATAQEKEKAGGPFLHRAVSKEFPGLGFFSGTVTAFDASEQLWMVTYTDGDTEEFKEAELLPLLVPVVPQSTPLEKKRPAVAVALPMDTEDKAKKKAKIASS
jgi:hypothetical protein